MNVNMNISAAITQNASDTVGLSVLKKAINIEAQNAISLMNAIPQPPQQSAANPPPHLGKNINTMA